MITVTGGRFGEADGQEARQTFRVQAMDCPHLWEDPAKRAEIETQIRSLRPELVQSMIYGEFMPESAGMVFDMARVADAMAGRVAAWGQGRFKKAALDISAGGDEQVLGVCDVSVRRNTSSSFATAEASCPAKGMTGHGTGKDGWRARSAA